MSKLLAVLAFAPLLMAGDVFAGAKVEEIYRIRLDRGDLLLARKGAMEILNVNGMIAAGEPHFHMTLSTTKGAFGGHLENGCKVLYRAELTIAKFAGAPLARKPNAAGVPMLQQK